MEATSVVVAGKNSYLTSMDRQDIRWQQRLSNYQRALLQLNKAVELSHQRPLNELEQQGLIQAFEFTHDLLLPYKIDLALLHVIDSQGLLDHIKRVGKVFYARRLAAA